ncbi:hypothetical protein C1634_025605, partial [Chryseobacterium viscerum]
SSGTLSENTTVGQGIHTLAFTSGATNGFSVDGATFSVDAANDRLGVGTVSPKVTLDVAARAIDGSAAEGFKVPMLTGNALYAAAINGKYSSEQNSAIVYVTVGADVSKRTGQTEYMDSDGFYYFDSNKGISGKWIKFGSGGSVSPVLGSLDCNGSLSVGHLYSGEISNGVSSVVSYTNGNGAAYNAQDILSTGVTGLTAHLSAGSLSNGNGSLTYTINGTPSGPGTASFAIGIGGQSCTLTRTVVLSSAVSSLDCSGAVNSGTLTEGSAVSGVSSVISYTGGSGGLYSAQSVSSTGVTGLTATLASGTFMTGTGSLTYKVSGTPSMGGTASFLITIGGQSCTLTRDVLFPVTVSSLDCSGAVNNGTLTGGSAASGVSSVISYTGGDGSTYDGQSVSSTGVTGLTATFSSGTLANGNGSVTYTISGTPSAGGIAYFPINIGGKSCVLTRMVNPTPGITLAQNRTYMIASVYDDDYLPYTVPTGAATTNTQAADGSNEVVTVNVQGTITPSGVMITIPVTATGSGTLPAYSTTITIPADMTEDGISRNLTLSWASQAYTSGTKSITATIKAIGGTLNVKKLDVNSGIGNDALGVLMGQFTYPYNSAGNTTSYSVRDIAGIPDRMFGVADNTGSTSSHMMLYLPIVAEDGNIWLNNNLGANYANINHASFDPAQQATSSIDYLAYGSLFQWGRKPDGHELMTWTSGTAGTAVNGTTSTLNNTPGHALFISSNTDWRTTQDDTLWASASSANNPCPLGFKVPTATEITTLATAAGITNGTTAASSALKFPLSGRRSFNGSFSGLGSFGYYWSSSIASTNSSYYVFGSNFTVSSVRRAFANGVRCIKD